MPGRSSGVVFQQPRLFPWRSVGGNVELALRYAGTPRQERAARRDEILSRVGLDGIAGRRIWEISGGQQQRVAIARALASERSTTSLLLLDEPFAALDALTRERLQEDIRTVSAESGRTTVFVTHSADEAVFLGSRIVVLTQRPGRLPSTGGRPAPHRCRPRRTAALSGVPPAETACQSRGEGRGGLTVRKETVSAKFFWFLPTNGDSRSIVGPRTPPSTTRSRPDTVRRPADTWPRSPVRPTGWDTRALTPTGTWCEDAWLTASALLAETERLKFLVAFRPGLVPPTLAAQQAATLQRFSDGRLLLNGSAAVRTPSSGDSATSSATTNATGAPESSCGSSGTSGTVVGRLRRGVLRHP